MKNILLLVVTILFIAFCSCRVSGPARPTRTFVVVGHRSRHHWGAPRRWSVHTRYWTKHRYGMRVHKQRGRFRD